MEFVLFSFIAPLRHPEKRKISVMSGVEITGLVLGAFPILIEALQRYRAGADILDDWWRYKTAYLKCEQQIRVAEVFFEGNVERLLLPIVMEESERKQLIEDPKSELWANTDLEVRLKESLPKSYEVILHTIVDICECIESLKREFGLVNEATKLSIDKVSVRAHIFRTIESNGPHY